MTSPNSIIDDIIFKLSSDKKYLRDKGYSDFEEYLKRLPERRAYLEEKVILYDSITNVLEKSIVKNEIQPKELPRAPVGWEKKQSFLNASKALILFSNPKLEADKVFINKILELSFVFINHEEARVRNAAGDTIGAICIKNGTSVFKLNREKILSLINTSIENISKYQTDDFSPEERKTLPPMEFFPGSMDKKVFHTTAGFRVEEGLKKWDIEMRISTSLKLLQTIVENLKNNFAQFIDQSLLSQVFKCLTLKNRYARESGFYLLEALIQFGNISEESINNEIAEHISNGLNDFWTKVRMAASNCSKKFLLANKEDKEKYYGQIMPRMCLNRYYVDEGVRRLSLENWKEVVGKDGPTLVEKYIDKVVEFYIACANLNEDKSSRLASCNCFSELSTKISQTAVSPYVLNILNTLITCFEDKFWPIKDAACLACGNFMASHPEESKSKVSTLMPLFFSNLKDSIPSVRQGAAAAISQMVKAHKEEVSETVIEHIQKGMAKVSEQPPSTNSTIQNPSNPSTNISHITILSVDSFNIPTPPNINEEKPKDNKTESEPWEITDGCVYLIGELAGIGNFKDELLSLAPLLIKASESRHFDGHFLLLESICKIIPLLAKGLGKTEFKAMLPSFFEIIFYCIESKNHLAGLAGQNCLSQLIKIIGQNILKSHIENYNPRFLTYYEGAIYYDGAMHNRQRPGSNN